MTTGQALYSVLSAIGALCLAIAYYKRRSKLVFLFFFAVMGITVFFDYLIYAWGKAYLYRPGFTNSEYDTHVGAIVNGIVLSATSALFAVASAGWRWSITLGLTFTGVEVIFEQLGIFRSAWWSPLYTFLLLSAFFMVNRKWWMCINRPHGVFISIATLTLIGYAIMITWMVIMYALLQSRTFHIEWFDKLGVIGTVINTPMLILFSLGYTLLRFNHCRKEGVLFVICGYYAIDLWLKHARFIQAGSDWDWVYFLVLILLGWCAIYYSADALKRVPDA